MLDSIFFLSVVQNEIMVCATNTDYVKDRLRKTETPMDAEASGLSGFPVYRMDHAAPSGPDQRMNQPSVEKTKMQDAAIQATPACSSFDGNPADHNSSDLKVDESVQTSASSRSTQHSSSSLQDSVDASKASRSPSTQTHVQERLPMKESACVSGNDGPLSPVDGSDKIPAALYQKNAPLYRQDYSPKPKPSNEITREYIPKIGMTTYKIVPPKSLEIVKAWESEPLEDKDGQKMHAVGQKHVLENTKETAMQTEDALATSRGSREPQPDLKPKPSPGTERHLQRTLSSPTGAENPLKPPRVTMDTGGVPFAPNLEDINNILESKFRARASNPQAKPSSFFLQMQKRASGHYVTSAAAKSVHTAPGPTPKEPATKEMQRDSRPPPEQILSPLSERTHSAPLPSISKTDGIIQKPAEISLPPVAPKPVAPPAEISPPPVAPPAETSLPPVAPKPVALSGGQGTSLNLKTLKTFGAPRPYSSSGPSPFALAVVKRSQSFSKARPESPSEDCSAQPAADREGEKTHTVNKPAVVPQHDDVDKVSLSISNIDNQIPVCLG